MTVAVKSPKKLIEVALPLDAINEACAYEKMPGIGAHPRGIHLWWARRPLAAARAVIFSQLVNDPSWKWEMEHSGEVPPNNLKASWAASRKRLFEIIKDLVKWENTSNEAVIDRARMEIVKSWKEVCELNKTHEDAASLFNPDRVPAFHDPFAGGGALPLEAQRLGLDAYASDLNPVAVLINKAMIEIPAKFQGKAPIGPALDGNGQLLAMERSWPGVTGLAEDILRYGKWIEEAASKKVGHLYPPIHITEDVAKGRPDLVKVIGKKLPVTVWLWARTVRSPNPAFGHVDVPLLSSFVLSSKKNRDIHLYPVVKGDKYSFDIHFGKPGSEFSSGTKASGRGSNFRCLVSGSPIDGDYIKSEGKAGRMGIKLIAVVADGPRGKLYLPADAEAERVALNVKADWRPGGLIPPRLSGGTCVPYGLTEWGDLFTNRQLVVLSTLSELLESLGAKIAADAKLAGMVGVGARLSEGGTGPVAYADAVVLYLAFAINRLADFGCTLATWKPSGEQVMHLFTRQSIPMTWDFPESNFLGNVSICFKNAVKYTSEGLAAGVGVLNVPFGLAVQADAQTQEISKGKIISTDPPYYDNICYADVSDFFYVWLRKALKGVFPESFGSIETPKAEELVAAAYRHGSKEKADAFFLDGMTSALSRLALQAHPQGPITIYYAFKQSETDEESGTSSTGWATFLTALINSGFSIVGTWPLRSEQEFRMVSMGTNALASSIVLVCRHRDTNAPSIDRRGFLRELNVVLPEALDEMTRGTSDEQSPVRVADLSQAIIGPGMAIFSKYSAVLEADGKPMSVQTALQLINRYLAGDDLDPDTQFCLQWFEEVGWGEGKFGDADNIARSKGTSVDGVKEAGVIRSGSGKVRLLKWSEYPSDWNPKEDQRNPIWETLHQLIRALKQEGEGAAGRLLAGATGQMDGVRLLAYRLYPLCERKGWAEDAKAYNELTTGWSGIEAAASQVVDEGQQDLFGEKK